MGESVLVQPDTKFIRDVMAAGAGDLKKCYQCATCSAVCQLSTESVSFPRRQILAVQWGAKEKLLEDPAPWLCFYCGDCSERCPRGANPGETMMALRRYLTAQYDWTGLSRLMYRSAYWEIGILVLVAAIVVALFTIPQNFGFSLLSRSPEAWSTVMLDRFAPKQIVHDADRILAATLGFLLLSNAARMFRLLTRNQGIPMSVFFSRLPQVFAEAVTQRRWKNCQDADAARNWKRHLLLVSGYAVIFALLVVFLPWFQVEDNGFHWTSILGYYATAVLLWSTFLMLVDRVAKRTLMHRFSHLSDWLFPILLFLTAITGIAVHILRLSNQAMPTYVMYMVHLAIAVPMLVVEAPFGKWAHLLYRPLAICVAAATSQSNETRA
jgi:ferredoxin/nitrate reductase gamma subunit